MILELLPVRCKTQHPQMKSKVRTLEEIVSGRSRATAMDLRHFGSPPAVWGKKHETEIYRN